jgi:hypothetical protein
MAKKPKVTFTVRSKKRAPESERVYNVSNVNDIGESVAEEYNQYALATESWPTITAAKAAEILDRMFSPSDMDFFLKTEFGRGLLAGAVAASYSLEALSEQLLSEKLIAAGVDPEEMTEESIEELSEEELAQIIYDSVKKDWGGGPGGSGNGSSQH